MSMTLFGWLLIAASVAMSLLLLMLAARARNPAPAINDIAACKAGLEEIAARLKCGQLSDAEADAARLALLVRPAPSPWLSGRVRRGSSGPLTMAASVFFLVAGVGAATSLVKNRPSATPAAHAIAGTDDETLVRLKDYARASGTEQAAPAPETGTALPDVNTMIERLATRLESAPDDLEGWRLLGWSYAHTGQHRQAAAAFARALTLDPGSTELQQAREEAEAKAGQHLLPTPASTAPPETGSKSGPSGAQQAAGSEGTPQHDGAAIRAMVDGLANRLERAPQDVEGWTRLMRSRVVLGETDVATSALRKALDVFKDDAAASGRIVAAATALGLKAE
jgi:cytochrome c-type biogenesis protein CcmH/NrfG